MRYLYRRLNDANMFNVLNSILNEASSDHQLQELVSHFLYRVSCSMVSVDRMLIAEKSALQLVEAYKSQIVLGDYDRIAVSVEPLFEIYAQIPSVLSQIVIMQNQILKICEKAFKVNGNAPSSLNKALKKNLTSFGFSEELNQLVKEYWNNGGKYIRDIRNINEHHTSLVDNSFYILKDGIGKISVILPDNPEVKSVRLFTYEKDIDAIDTIIKSIEDMNKLLMALFESKSSISEPFSQSLFMNHMGELKKGEERTLGLLINIVGHSITEEGTELKLDTIEMKQTIPHNGGGNISVRKMVPDSELE